MTEAEYKKVNYFLLCQKEILKFAQPEDYRHMAIEDYNNAGTRLGRCLK